ncbi:MAG: SDR family oxidoreductase [SAR202 cluster bacterium]|nr:SDR family oxidoreductase [SAR202 cluster bacterium]
MSGNFRKTVFITGASSGIGKIASLYLCEKGYKVIGSSRKLGRLEALATEANKTRERFFPIELDINLKNGEPGCIEEVLPTLIDQHNSIDVLVNNAGYGLWGPLESISVSEMEDQFKTNVFAPFRLSKLLISNMRERGYGRIINISSVAGWVATPFNGAYASSKFALEAQTEALRMELWPFGVTVSSIQPGLFDTDFQSNMVQGMDAESEELPYKNLINRYRRKHKKWRKVIHDPIRIAKLIERIIESDRPRLRYPIGFEARAGILGSKIFPERIYQWMISRTSM